MSEAGSDSPHLDEDEQRQAEEHAALPARVIHEIIREEGEAALERSASALAWSGLAAGLSMGFCFLAQGVLRSMLPDEPWRPLVVSAGYTTGFIIVILGRQQLFTESTLSALLPALTRPGLKTLGGTLRVWGYVLTANMAGAWLFAILLRYAHPFAPEVKPALQALAHEAMEGEFGTKLAQGVVAGWLIAVMAWLLPNAKTARLFIIMLITYLVGAAGLPHIVAGAGETAYAVLDGQAGFGEWLARFFAPTLIGNLVGGTLLVAILNHAPIRSELGGIED